MQLAILSDLHLEFLSFDPPPALAAADVVVLAGDIHNGIESLHWARRAFEHQRIVQVAGNHEFFGGCWQTVLAQLRETAQALEIDFLENDAVVIDGVRFLGATLWTDFELYSVPGRPLGLDSKVAKGLMQRRLVDFSAITWHPLGGDDGPRALTPDDTVGLHRASRDWLSDRLHEPMLGPSVVVSHHLPSWGSIAPTFLRAVSNTAFASDLDALVARATLWIHGHTHYSFDYRIGGNDRTTDCGPARVVANPRGYPLKSGAMENPSFDPGLLIELDATV